MHERGPIRWSRIIAGIAVIALLGPEQNRAARPPRCAATARRSARPWAPRTWGLFLGVFVFAGLGTLLILQGTVWRKPRHI